MRAPRNVAPRSEVLLKSQGQGSQVRRPGPLRGGQSRGRSAELDVRDCGWWEDGSLAVV